MRYRPAAITAAAALALGGAVLVAAPAQAHDNTFTATCDAASITLSNYPAGSHITGYVDAAVVVDQDFGPGYTASTPLDGTRGHTVRAVVTSGDGDPRYSFDRSLDTTACVVPDQPAPRVTEASSESVDCTALVVTVHHSTDTYGSTYDRTTNTWVEDTTPVHADQPDTTRPLSDIERQKCRPAIHPTIHATPPAGPAPADQTPAAPAAALDANKGETLAQTGVNGLLVGSIAAALLLAGVGGILYRRRHTTR